MDKREFDKEYAYIKKCFERDKEDYQKNHNTIFHFLFGFICEDEKRSYTGAQLKKLYELAQRYNK